jgi:hypothetical protein
LVLAEILVVELVELLKLQHLKHLVDQMDLQMLPTQDLPLFHKVVLEEMEVAVIVGPLTQMEMLEDLEVDQHNLLPQAVAEAVVDGPGPTIQQQLMGELEVLLQVMVAQVALQRAQEAQETFLVAEAVAVDRHSIKTQVLEQVA